MGTYTAARLSAIRQFWIVRTQARMADAISGTFVRKGMATFTVVPLPGPSEENLKTSAESGDAFPHPSKAHTRQPNRGNL